MTKHLIVLLAIIALTLTPAGLGQSDRRAERPNIVFILVDDLRWDELGITGHLFLKRPISIGLAPKARCFATHL